MQQRQDLWPEDVQSLDSFETYAGLVQSRAFHMLTENWITGSAQEGLYYAVTCRAMLLLYFCTLLWTSSWSAARIGVTTDGSTLIPSIWHVQQQGLHGGRNAE